MIKALYKCTTFTFNDRKPEHICEKCHAGQYAYLLAAKIYSKTLLGASRQSYSVQADQTAKFLCT